ncbi:hypothetical protein ACI782_25035 [Geodermatophilus sp. SYSU D00703]
MTTQRSADDGDHRGRCGTAHPGTTHPAGCSDRVPHVPLGARRPIRTPDGRQGLIEQLRQAAVYVETAAVLERRAVRSADPNLAALLRERAEVRRRTAERLRAALAEQRPLPRRFPDADRESS